MAKVTSQEAAQRLIDALDTVAADGSWGDYLRFLNSFHQYSPFNRMLIYVQNPDATHVMGFGNKAGTSGWKSLGRHVRRGEKGIQILAPLVRTEKDETGKVVDRFIYGFRTVSVFDVSQTDGEPLPQNPASTTLLTGDHDGFDTLAAYAESIGFTVERGDCHGANGYTDFSTQTIRVRDDVDTAQAVKTMAHELGHALLHRDTAERHVMCRGTAEVEAESVAFLVADRLGLDTSDYTFGYISEWATATKHADKPSAAVKASLNRIVAAADQIVERVTVTADDMEVAA